MEISTKPKRFDNFQKVVKSDSHISPNQNKKIIIQQKVADNENLNIMVFLVMITEYDTKNQSIKNIKHGLVSKMSE